MLDKSCEAIPTQESVSVDLGDLALGLARVMVGVVVFLEGVFTRDGLGCVREVFDIEGVGLFCFDVEVGSDRGESGLGDGVFGFFGFFGLF